MWDHCARVSGMECEETTRILEQRGISDFHGPLRLVNDSTRWAYCPSHLSNNEVWFRLYTCYHGCANMGNSDLDAYGLLLITMSVFFLFIVLKLFQQIKKINLITKNVRFVLHDLRII